MTSNLSCLFIGFNIAEFRSRRGAIGTRRGSLPEPTELPSFPKQVLPLAPSGVTEAGLGVTALHRPLKAPLSPTCPSPWQVSPLAAAGLAQAELDLVALHRPLNVSPPPSEGFATGRSRRKTSGTRRGSPLPPTVRLPLLPSLLPHSQVSPLAAAGVAQAGLDVAAAIAH